MLEARIHKRFPPGPGSSGFTLDVDLRAAAGVTVLFGPSGAGKTLTLDCLAGFVRPAEGRILLDGRILFDAPSAVNLPPRARQCGYVFQDYALFPHMTLRQNLAFAAGRFPRIERRRQANEMLDRFGLAGLAARFPHQLSGGQKQRGSIARALLGGPKILLLDEPAQGLDAPLRAEMYSVLRQVREEFALPVLLVTHSLDECCELGDEMHVLLDGAIAQSGSPRQVLAQPSSLEVARLLALYNLLPAEIRALDPSRNFSRLRHGDFDLQGPYFPGRFIGDQVTIYVSPSALTALPRNGKPAPNQLPLALLRTTDRPETVRLEFEQGIAVDMPRHALTKLGPVKEWLVEFPSESLRVL